MKRALFARLSMTLASLAVGVLMTTLAATSVSAQQYPASPIRIVVGFGAGSTADTLARLLSRHMETKLGQPVIVENRPGNSSMLAAETVARAPKDGYTFFMATVANTLNPAQTGSGFDLAKEMAPVALLGVVPNVLVAHPSIPAKNVKDLIVIAKSKPDTLTFGTSGAGTASHLAAELFNAKAGTKIVAVHYQGGANQGVPDLLSGRITLMFNVAAALAPHAAAGKVVPLAVGQPKRASIMPNVPTMDEAGMPGFDVGIWIGLLAPAGTPAEIVDKVSAVANEGLKTEAVMTAMRTQGIDPIGGTPKEFEAFIRADIKKWDSILETTGLKKK
ncbi:MAG: tripartite tricarboxylate transporter substrate-binding protein [Pseudolabrys sp.]|nr:tripartite tricarboxylate transporter substrate-binding protein [Pseudolabrys sp.]